MQAHITYIHIQIPHTHMYMYIHYTYTHFLSECQALLLEASTAGPWLQVGDASSLHELG